MSRESYKAQAAVRESSATARDSAVRRPALQESATAQAAVRDSSLAIVTSGVHLSEVDKAQLRERVEAEKRATKSKSKTTSERKSRPKTPSPGEEEIIHIELPPPAPKKPDTITDSDSVHRAKLVNLPFMMEDSDVSELFNRVGVH
ncbi:unnamed protein product [Heligmosomoides polygyrus]|uniref:RRM domain-containing protein n=1 Tax=Heligmosomoides polygyrus TaxID=6339 RepID=A0A183GE95_HELPZ|nr:unnamed protein product [Heligmosomoides polygyrus]